jgi:5-deoxy-5-amino-3-dehydroquinate synthase
VTGNIYLIGSPGSGKSTVGRILAERLGRQFVDTDDEVERGAGMTVAEIFASEGETGFRDRERAAVAGTAPMGRHLHRRPRLVVAVGGGAPTDSENRAALGSVGNIVVWLRATPATLAGRLGEATDRPLLAGNSRAALERLDVVRRPLYSRLARVVVDVDESAPDEAAAAVEAAVESPPHALIKILVPLADRSYTVLVGRGAATHLGDLLPQAAKMAALVTQESVPFEVELPIETARFAIGEGEGAKSLSTIESLCRGFARVGLTRSDVVVSVGGGVVSDVAGFAASVYHRGVAVVHIPTTLLAQVDAAIGGKTGVNLPEGKNLVGSFWQPTGVCCDTSALDLLPDAELRSGRGEMVKYAFIGVPALADLPIEEQVARCVELKATVVAADERESGRRMTLNYGHTLAHALEAAGFADVADGADGADGPAPALRHGEAVAIGLVYAARLARRLGRIGDARVEQHVALVRGDGLPTGLPAGADPHELLSLMRRDKKSSGGLTFVLDGPHGVEPVSDVDESVVLAALGEMEVAEVAATATGTAEMEDE